MRRKLKLIGITLFVAAALVAVYMKGHYDGHAGKGLPLTKEAIAAKAQAKESRRASTQTVAPVKALAPADRDIYYPSAEDLAPDEIRVMACGSGAMPPTRNEASPCFLVELGNGEKFIFDIGVSSFERLRRISCRPTKVLGWAEYDETPYDNVLWQSPSL